MYVQMRWLLFVDAPAFHGFFGTLLFWPLYSSFFCKKCLNRSWKISQVFSFSLICRRFSVTQFKKAIILNFLRLHIRFLFLILYVCSSNLMQAQAPSPSGRGQEDILDKDTSRLTYRYATRPEIAFPEGDSLPGRAFYIVDPARSDAVDWATLGNIGSPARPLFFQRQWRQGFAVGAKIFDIYGLKADSLRYYRSRGAFTDVQYAQGRGQSEGIFRGKFARTFSDDITFTLDYKGINHAGQFLHQRVKHNALSFGLWKPKKKRWEGFLSFTQNVYRQQENGGIVDSVNSIGSGVLSSALGVGINLSEQSALSRIGNWTLLGTQHFDLIGKKNGRKLSLVHQLSWSKERYKFFDVASNTDFLGANAQFLGDTFYVDARGIRNYGRTGKVENKFSLRTFKVRPDGGNDQLSVGVEHSFWKVQYIPSGPERFNQLFFTGNMNIQLKQSLGLQARAALGLLTNTGEYNVEGTLFWSLGKAGTIEGAVLQQRVQPYRYHTMLFLSDRTIWMHDFSKIFDTKFVGKYSLPIAGLSATVQNQTINNFVYVNQNRIPEQTGSPVNITQFLIQEKIRWRALGSTHTLALQTTNNTDILRLPDWYYRGSLYATGLVFRKNMLARIGTEVRLNAAYLGDAYMPATWQFYLQDVRELPTYPWIDLFLSLKVQNLRFFVRYENLGDALFTDKLFFQTDRYPQMPAQLRISLAWRFRDL